MKKLSKAKQMVIDRMSEGWQLGLSSGMRPHAWLQQNGVGRSGPIEDVHLNTFVSLRKAGLLQCITSEMAPTQKYILTGPDQSSPKEDMKRKKLKGIICIPEGPFKVGDLPPTGYVAWHEWAAAQYKGGLRQVRDTNGKWKFPQELLPG